MGHHTQPDYSSMEGSREGLGLPPRSHPDLSEEVAEVAVPSGTTRRRPPARRSTPVALDRSHRQAPARTRRSAPADINQESIIGAFMRGWRDGGAELHPWRRVANAFAHRAVIAIVIGLIILIPLPLIGAALMIIGYGLAVISLVMYLAYPFVLMVWPNPNKPRGF